MRKTFLSLILVAVLAATAFADEFRAGTNSNDGNPGELIWDSPSADARGSMPIGNGDISASVWVEPSGDLVFFIGKTDAWDEKMTLLKVGKVRVKFSPPLVQSGKPFTQTLDLAQGRILIQNGEVEVSFWVDANHPVIQVDAKSVNGTPISATASFELWRNSDTVLPATAKQIGWYHRDVSSPWLASLRLQKLEEMAKTEQDPILHRTIGAILRGEDFAATSATELKTQTPATELSLHIHVLTQITDTPEQWQTALEEQASATEAISAADRWQEHCQWWNGFWNRSWIFVDGSRSLAVPANHQPWRVGVASTGGSRFGGSITDPLIVGRALSPDEISALAGQPRTDAGTVPGDVAVSGGCTVAAWINPAAGEAGRIIDKCTAGQPDGLIFDTYPGLSLRLIVGNDTMVVPDCLTPGEWQHVAATVDADMGVRRIYLNGKLVKEERNDLAAKVVTRAYILQRWINACGGRGAFPIKFNGSIFVVDSKADNYNADYRRWGGGYWFQNTRLPYWSMLDSGDFDLMQPLFNMYMKSLPARELAARTYYGHGGAFYPETQSFWGNYMDGGDIGYGTDRTDKPDGLTDNQYIRRYWDGGIELVAMMLDYYDMTQDTKFRDHTLIPFATQIIAFYDQHWQRGADGKILFHPAQALETWWDCTNPTPDVAGLHDVIPRLQKLTSDPALNAAWQKTLDDLPPVPLSDDAPKRILPAEKFAIQKNAENAELYAVFPFRLFTLTDGDEALGIGRNTFAARRFAGNGGWQQNSIQAALLGLTDIARREVVESASHHGDGFRFPAMWGPNFDWLPDQDHGSVILIALQRMLIQYDDNKILLTPAWPKEWDARFKLHAPNNTTVEGVIKDGKVSELEVTPESRRKDVVILPMQ
jgi:hypothetical protein